MAGYRCVLLDGAGQAVAAGEAGELVLRGRFMALGAWRAGALEAGALEADPEDPAGRLHRTGDLAVRDAAGLYTVLGRLDRQIKILGNRVEPGEIEAWIRARAGVADVAVLVRPGSAELVAYVVPTTDAQAGLRRRLSEALAAALPSAMQPRRIHLLAALPLLPSGKIDAVALLRR